MLLNRGRGGAKGVATTKYELGPFDKVGGQSSELEP